MPRGRLRGLRFQPAHRRVRWIGESVDAADPREGDVAGGQSVLLAIEGRVDLAVEDEIGLLERMVP